MTRAKITPTHTHRAQHPRMFSSSSSSSSISSSSSCSLSPGPLLQKTSTTATTTTASAIERKKRSSWMLSHHEKPGWEDTTTSTLFEEQPQQHQNHKGHDSPMQQHTLQRRQKSGSYDQVVPTTSSHSPPSSPLPLGLHKQNGATETESTTTEDMDSEDNQHRRYKQYSTGRVVQGRTSAASDYSSGQHSARSAMQAAEAAATATAARSRRKETGGSAKATMPTEISSRPRFSLSTVVNPRSQVYSVGAATREAAVVPKDVSTKSTTTRLSRTVKESVATPRVAKSTASSLGGHAQPTTKSISTTRISKSRSPTTITTTTTTTTRRVASTTITMGPHLDREHRKLAAAASTSAAASALATKSSSSSSRRERIARAASSSTLSPASAGAARRATMSREGGHQTGVEPVVKHTDAINIPTTASEHSNNIVDNKKTTQQLDIGSDPVPEPTTSITTALLPALQMKGEESLEVKEYPRPVQDTTSAHTGVAINNTSSKQSSLSLPPPPAAEATEISFPILSSSIIAASRPKTPPPPYQTAILHNAPNSDLVRQTPDTPTLTACTPPKETTPMVQERKERTEGYLARPTMGVMTTFLSRTQASPLAGARNPGIAKSMTAATPPTFLSGTPRIFRSLRETSSPHVLSLQQQQPRLTSQSEINIGAEGDQEGPAKVPTTPVPATIRRNKSTDLIPTTEQPTYAHSILPTTLPAPIPITIPDPEGAEKIPQTHQQPFRKNIWNGRLDRFNKSRSTILSPEEAIPTAEGNASARTGLLAAIGTNVSRAPLTKAKDPVVMRDLMVLAKERRASRTLCDGVSEDGVFGTQPISSGGNQFRVRSRMMMKQFEHRNDNDNDTPATSTTTSTTNHNNAKSNAISTSAPSGKITLEDKKAFLKTQEIRRRSNQRRSQSLNTVDTSSASVSSYYPFSTSPSPAQGSLSIDTHPGFSWKDRSQQGRTATSPIPAMSVTIPLKVATVLQGMGYPINNTNTATSPLCSSPSTSPSPTWSTPSTPRIIPSSLSSSSLSSLSSVSTASSVSSTSSTSASSKTLPLSFPDRLFQARSPSSSTGGGASVAMMPRSFSPRPVRATSINGASAASYYPTPSYNNQAPQSSTMLPSLPSPALSLAVPERQRVSSRSVEGYFKPRLFSGSRSEDEQLTSQQARQHTLGPFERALVQQHQQQQQNKLITPQRAAAAAGHSTWSDSSTIKSSSMSHLFPLPSPPSPSSLFLTDQDDSTVDSDRERRVHERSASTTSIDRPFTEQACYNQNQYSQEDQQQSCASAPATQDISFLTKRLANLQLMDSLCPVSNPTQAQEQSLQPQQQQQQQQQQAGMDATWAMQIQLLLTHLAEQTDIEQESRPYPVPPPPRPLSLLLPLPEDAETSQKKSTGKVEGVGLYKQVLTDWLLRLDQLSAITSSSGGSLYKDYPGLKREVEKIRWQQNVPSKSNRSK